jgi:hypothetical protein
MGLRSKAGLQQPPAVPSAVKSAAVPHAPPASCSGSTAAALKSKRGRVTKARSGAYMLLGRYQVDRLLRVKERNGEWVEAAGHSLQAG